MNLPLPKNSPASSCRAFTLVEMMVVVGTLTILLTSVICCNLFGLSMAVRQQIWLGASDDAARTVGTLTSDIRAATSLSIGNYTSGGGFVATPDLTNQVGNALLIHPTSNPLPWTLYYYDTVSSNLMRSNYVSSSSAGDSRLVSANPIIADHPIFSEVDYTGTVTTVSNAIATISIYLSFTKFQNPQVVIAPGSLVDLYQIVTRASPRVQQ